MRDPDRLLGGGDRIPRHIIGAGMLLVAMTIGLSAVSKRADIGRTPDQPGPSRVRDLVFERTTDDAMIVRDARSGEVLERLHSADEGFIAGALRGLSFERRRQEKPAAAPYRLIERPGQGLALIDPSTGVYVQLEAFGRDNVQALSRYLPAPPRGVAALAPQGRHTPSPDAKDRPGDPQ